MKVNHYNQFILESSINELINESKLIAGDNYKSALRAVQDIQINGSIGLDVYNLSKALLSMIDRDFDSPINYIDMADKPGMITFIPEDKIEYDDVRIDYNYILNKNDNELLKILKISLDNLKTQDTINNDLKNSFKLIEKIYIEKIKNKFGDKDKSVLDEYSDSVVFYLQNNEDKNTFIAVCIGRYSPSDALINNKIPENRRTESKIGRAITKMLNVYYSNRPSNRKVYNAQVIEKFVNMFIACAIEMKESFNNFKIVDGEHIKKWYNVKNYSKTNGHSSGQLGSSCMRYEECHSFFNIYIKNPEVCKLLILLDKDDKLIGRSLLWTLIDGSKVMDRIYTSRDSLMHLFEKWGRKNGYVCKFKTNEQMSVKVKPIKYSKYPYMDTFCYYLPEKGILTNVYDFSPFKKFKKTSGSIIDTLKNPKILFNISTYKTTPNNTELVFTLNDVEGDHHFAYTRL